MRDTSPLQERVAAEVRALAARDKVKQIDIAKVLGLRSQSRVSLLMNGLAPFSLDQLERLAAYFSVPIATLLDEGSFRPPAVPAAMDRRQPRRGRGNTVRYGQQQVAEPRRLIHSAHATAA